MVKHTCSWPSQKTQDSRASIQMRISVSGSAGPNSLLVVRASLGYTVLAPSFPSTVLLGILLSSGPLFSISSLRCLLTSHSKWIEILFRNKSIFRKQCSLPGQLIAMQPWLSPLQGALCCLVATSTCRRHRLSLQKSCCTRRKSSTAQCARHTVCEHVLTMECPQTVIHTHPAGKGCPVPPILKPRTRGHCDVRDWT